MNRKSRRTDLLAPRITPPLRFLWGIGLILILVLSPSWALKTGLTLMAAGLTVMAGKRVQFGYFLFLLATVLFFQLLLPFGKVLVQAGPLLITDGALREGYDRGITLCGLVFISLFSVSRGLGLPGKLGKLWALTFSYYERLLEARKSLHRRRLMLSIDAILENHYPTKGQRAHPLEAPVQDTRTRPSGWLLIIASLVLCGILWWVSAKVAL